MKRDDAPSDRSRCSTPPLALGNNNQLMMATGKDTTGNGEASEGGGEGEDASGEGDIVCNGAQRCALTTTIITQQSTRRSNPLDKRRRQGKGRGQRGGDASDWEEGRGTGFHPVWITV